MFEYIKKALSGSDTSVSSRRLNTFISMVVGVIVNFSIIILAFKVALSDKPNMNAIAALEKLLYLTLIVQGVVFLLTGVITWQNINDSASIIKGLPQQVDRFKQTVTELNQPIKLGEQ